MKDKTILSVRVSSMESARGNKVPNQFHITIQGDGHYFQSYQTMIAYKDFMGNVTLDENAWNYSRTTSKYRSIFLDESTDETRKKIESGEYKLANLN